MAWLTRALLRSSCSSQPCFESILRVVAATPAWATRRLQHSDAPGEADSEASEIPSSTISRPLADILRELNRRVPDRLVKIRVEEGFTNRYVPWHVVNRIMNLHAPEWSGEVRSITYSNDGKSVSVVYRVTIYGVDAEIHREATGSASTDDTGFGDPVQKAEAMAFRRACSRFGLGLHLYHEDIL